MRRECARESDHIGPLWIDLPDALALNDASDASPEEKALTRDVINDGLCVVRDVIPADLCDRVIADFAKFCDETPDIVRRDTLGRETRVVNFHRWSDAALEIGASPRMMGLMDHMFGMETCVYTSLLFKYGTQQPIHRDTPHFGTWPAGYYFGVWYALEDVRDDAGPLMLHRGAHRFRMDQFEIYDRIARERPDAGPDAVADAALLEFCDEVVARSRREFGEPELVPVRRGDVILWHPELPHGGSPARDTSRTRWSIVFHCAPVAVQVHQHQTFFRHRVETPPPPRYKYSEAFGRKVAVAGGAAFP